LKDYAAKTKSVYADYFAATVDEKGFLKQGISRDGLHPNDKGYELMVPVVSAAIQQALGQ
jgi:lysophospholipase L1-like esterase